MRDVLHDSIDLTEELVAKARDEVRKVFDEELVALTEEVLESEEEQRPQDSIITLFELVAARIATQLNPVTTTAAKKGFELGKRMQEVGGVGEGVAKEGVDEGS